MNRNYKNSFINTLVSSYLLPSSPAEIHIRKYADSLLQANLLHLSNQDVRIPKTHSGFHCPCKCSHDQATSYNQISKHSPTISTLSEQNQYKGKLTPPGCNRTCNPHWIRQQRSALSSNPPRQLKLYQLPTF